MELQTPLTPRLNISLQTTGPVQPRQLSRARAARAEPWHAAAANAAGQPHKRLRDPSSALSLPPIFQTRNPASHTPTALFLGGRAASCLSKIPSTAGAGHRRESISWERNQRSRSPGSTVSGSEQASGGAELRQLFVKAELGSSSFQHGRSRLPRRLPACMELAVG